MAGRLQGRKKFGIEKARRIGPIVRAPVLRDHRLDLRKAADDGTHPIDVAIAFFQRDRRRHRRPDPQVALFELGQEFESERADGQTREQQQHDRAGDGQQLVRNGETQHRRIQAMRGPHHPRFGLVDMLGQ